MSTHMSTHMSAEPDDTVIISTDINTQTVHIKGSISNFSEYSEVILIAANAIDRMTSYSGSGLPFPCQDIAFDKTPNYVRLSQASFEVLFKYPNSYYTYDNRTKVGPAVFLIKVAKDGKPSTTMYDLQDILVTRTLNYRSGWYSGPTFLAKKEDIVAMQSAEGVMRSLATAKGKNNIA